MITPPPPSSDVADVAVVRRLDQEPRGYDRVWEPYLARSGDTLLVAYGRKLKEKSDMGDILCSHSADQGATWSDPVTVFDSNVPVGGRRFAYANAILYHPPGHEAVWCFGMRCPLHYRDSEDSQVCAAYSVDGGLSWQQVELAMSFHSAMIVVAGIQAVQKDGRTKYLLPAHRNTQRWDPKGDCQQFVLESDDLLCWRLAGYVPRPEKVFLHEGNIAPGDHVGELKIVMRTSQLKTRLALNPPTAYSSVSQDGGHTWTAARAEPSLYNSVSKGYYGSCSGGRHIYVYSDGPAWERKALKYVVQSADGRWSAPRTFFDTNTHNSYPTLEEESPGVFLCTWDSSDDPDHVRTVIRFGRLKIP
jgi:hypothetical protein